MTSEAPACAILDDYQDAASDAADWSALNARMRCDRFDVPLAGTDDIAEALAGYDAVVAMRERTPFSEEVLARLPDLKLIVTTGMANAAIDLDAAARRGVTVCGTGNVVGPAAELAWGLLLALMREIPAEVENFRAGGRRWQMTLGNHLSGRTLGVVGLGKLGRLMAGYGKAFGMDVVGWTRTDAAERCEELGIERAETLDQLLAGADVVALQVRLNAQTHGMIGKRELALMKPGAILVNTARGPLVDEAALIEALREGRLAGAALDVYDTEPLPFDHPFRTLDNVVATPHLGYVTRGTYAVFYRDAVECLAGWLDGKPVRVLNQPTGRPA